MAYDPNDPRITAYVLGELDGHDKTAFEAEMAAGDDLRQVVQDTRQTLDRLSQELAAEPSAALTDEARQAVTREINRLRGESREGPPPVSLAPPAGRSVVRWVVAVGAIAASLLVLAGGSLVWYSMARQYRTSAVAEAQMEQMEMSAARRSSMKSLPAPDESTAFSTYYGAQAAPSTSPVGMDVAGQMGGAGPELTVRRYCGILPAERRP